MRHEPLHLTLSESFIIVADNVNVEGFSRWLGRCDQHVGSIRSRFEVRDMEAFVSRFSIEHVA